MLEHGKLSYELSSEKLCPLPQERGGGILSIYTTEKQPALHITCSHNSEKLGSEVTIWRKAAYV